jgi:hypothetical protein
VRAIGVRAPEEPPQTVRLRHRRGWQWAIGTVLAGVVLMFCYLRIAGATEVNADAAGLVLQASDMLHGNLLLHGWWDTDVSFITTELPEYMGVTAVAGVRPEVVHICAALTYTLLVLLAAFVARGRARGAEGVVRALLAAGVMLAPQPTWITPILLGSPDHVGTALPLLLLLLLLDRLPPIRARLGWYIAACGFVCVITAALLAWTMVGDPLVEVVGVVPLIIASLLQAIRIVVIRLIRAWRSPAGVDHLAGRAAGQDAAGQPPDGSAVAGHEAAGSAVAGQASAGQDSGGQDRAADTSWRSACYHVLLAGAAAVAVPIAGKVNSWITLHQGYQLGPSRYSLLPLGQIAKNAPIAWQSFLALFGADYVGVKGAGNVAFALVHFVGVALVLVAVAFAAWRLLVPGRGARAGDLVANFLVLAVLVNVAAYFAFIRPVNIYDAHEIGPVASFGAALTGRMLGGPLLRFRRAKRELKQGQRDPESGVVPETGPDRKPRLRLPWLRPRGPRRRLPVLVPVLAAGLACYVALLGIAAAAPQGPPQDVDLATWLDQHDLRSGLASYWESASVTVNSDDKITMLAVGIHGARRRLGPDQWETDVRLADPATHTANFIVVGPDRIVPAKLALEMFGKPTGTYQFEQYTIMVYNKNLLGDLNRI